MELKQLEFFIAACECGSLSRAAEKLYTSQPNVSKVIRSLEDELGNSLFDRTSKGLKLTPYGKSIYEYAMNAVKNAEFIYTIKGRNKRNTFYVSTYQSNTIAMLLTDLYVNNKDITIEHRQGTVEEILNHVEHGISELGLLYVSHKQLNAFQNIVKRKDLSFVMLGRLKACVYAGPNSPLYERESIGVEELSELRYIRGLSDFFSIDDGLEHLSLGPINSEYMHPVVYTNSEHLTINLMLYTDLTEIGIEFNYPGLGQYPIKNLSIIGEGSSLILGYVTEEGHVLSKYASELINSIKAIINP